MKHKAIMYALGYGKSRKQLVRSEGARRVKQAENNMNLRKIQKNLTYCTAYGTYDSTDNFSQKGNKVRSISPPKNFGVPYGQDINIICEGDVDYLKLRGFMEK